MESLYHRQHGWGLVLIKHGTFRNTLWTRVKGLLNLIFDSLCPTSDLLFDWTSNISQHGNSANYQPN